MRRLAFALAAAALGGGAVAQTVRYDAAVQAVMAKAVNPAALAFWAGGNDPPEDETPAQAASRWAAATRGAQDLQVQAASLAGADRPADWNRYARMMADVAAEGEAAARARNAEAAFEIGGRLYDSCNGCHKAYVPAG